MTRESQIDRWMTADPITVKRTDTLLEAYSLMMDNGVRRLPVVDSEGGLVGIVTESDVRRMRPLVLEGHEEGDGAADALLSDRTVSEVMAYEPVTLQRHQSVQEAAETMIEAGVSGVPILEADRLVGIITESDIFRLVVEEWGRSES